jgi:hypothetical protein
VRLRSRAKRDRGASPPPAGSLRVSFIGVGQGDRVLVQAGGADYLKDAGRAEEGPNVVDFLRSRGVESLDGIVVTNPRSVKRKGRSTLVVWRFSNGGEVVGTHGPVGLHQPPPCFSASLATSSVHSTVPFTFLVPWSVQFTNKT